MPMVSVNVGVGGRRTCTSMWSRIYNLVQESLNTVRKNFSYLIFRYVFMLW